MQRTYLFSFNSIHFKRKAFTLGRRVIRENKTRVIVVKKEKKMINIKYFNLPTDLRCRHISCIRNIFHIFRRYIFFFLSEIRLLNGGGSRLYNMKIALFLFFSRFPLVTRGRYLTLTIGTRVAWEKRRSPPGISFVKVFGFFK